MVGLFRRTKEVRFVGHFAQDLRRLTLVRKEKVSAQYPSIVCSVELNDPEYDSNIA